MTNPRFQFEKDFPPVSYEMWRALVEQELKGVPFDTKLVTRLYEGIDLQPIYTEADSAGPDSLGFPGVMPFARGRDATLRPCGPRLVQDRREPAPSSVRAHILEDLEHGVDGVRLCFDRAGRLGLDGDVAEAREHLGVGGSCLYAVDDLEAVFEAVDLSSVSISLDAGATSLPAAKLLSELWKRRGCKPDQVHGAFQADPLGALAVDGRLPGTLRLAFDGLAATVRLAEEWPNVTALGVASVPYHDAGATAVGDLAYTMATALEYLRQLEARGWSPSRVAPQFLFEYSIGTNVFLATAKLRAARWLWARILQECGIDEPLRGMRMHVQMGRRVLTQRDPWVNILRNTACVFAALVGGADSVGSVPFDAALGLPSTLARRIARNTPIILDEEAHLRGVVDPAGGSFLLDELTTEVAEKAWSHLQEVERQGGMARALTSGWIGERIAAALAPRLKNIATRCDMIVGVSEFANLGEAPIETPQVSERELRAEVLRRAKHRKGRRRDAAPALSQLFQSQWFNGTRASNREFEIAAMPGPLTPHPLARDYEKLRDAADRHLANHGSRPRVYLVNLGTLAEYNARATYARGFFEAGGFEVSAHPGSDDPNELATAFARSGVGTAILCSTDTRYEQFAERVAGALRQYGSKHIVLAGNPGPLEARYRNAGIDRFIFIRCDVLDTLREVLRLEGVKL